MYGDNGIMVRDRGVIGEDCGRIEPVGGRVYLGQEDLVTWTKTIIDEVNY